MPHLQAQLTIIALSLWLIVFLGLTCVVFALVSMWKENRSGWPLRGIVWFTLAIAGSCAVIAILAGYVQKASTTLRRGLCLISARVVWHDPLLFVGVVPSDNTNRRLRIAQVSRLMWNIRRDVQKFTRTADNALAQPCPIGCLHTS